MTRDKHPLPPEGLNRPHPRGRLARLFTAALGGDGEAERQLRALAVDDAGAAEAYIVIVRAAVEADFDADGGPAPGVTAVADQVAAVVSDALRRHHGDSAFGRRGAPGGYDSSSP